MTRLPAAWVVRLAAALLPASMRDWGRAMEIEVAAIDRAGPALLFALGCLGGALRESACFHLIRPLARMSAGISIRGETTMHLWTDLHPRRLAVVCAVGATGLGLLYMAMAGASVRYLAMNGGALVLGLLLVAALASGPRVGHRAGGMIDLGLASALLLTSLLGASADGATRWIFIGGLSVQPSFLLLPILAMRFARSANRLSTLAVAIAALALGLQPDRAMAGALVAGMIALSLTRPTRDVRIALGAALAVLAATLVLPDTSPAVPYVDQIFYSSFAVHPLAGLAVLLGTGLMLVPALLGSLRDEQNREVYAAFGAIWLALAGAAALGNYPTPLVGYGGSAIVGYLISLVALPRRRHVTAADRRDATQPDAQDRAERLRAGLSFS